MRTKITHSLLWKSLAFTLSLILAVLALLCIAGVVYFAEDGYYTGVRTNYAQSSFFMNASHEYSYAAWLRYSGGASAQEGRYWDKLLDPANTNYRYAIFDSDGNRLAGTALEDTLLEEARLHGRVLQYWEVWPQSSGSVVSTLDPAMAVADAFVEQARLFDAFLSLRYWLIAIAAFSVIGMILLFVYLMHAAGRYPDAEKPECRALDRVPFDLYAFLCVGVAAAFGGLLERVNDWSSSTVLTVLLALALVAVIYGLFEALCMSFAARVKCRCLLRNTVIGRALRLLLRFAEGLCRTLPMLWKFLLGAVIFLILQGVIWVVSFNSYMVLALVFDIAAIVGACLIAGQMKRLQAGAKALSEGDFSRQLETRGLLPELKKHAELLNGIGVGMSRAVEARMKSERMKTDLITNVSHDIKTPLTAIISYVDLLKKEPLSPAAAEYAAVLEQQALRLKKLAEDVVEASKASSGAISVDLQPTNLVEIVNQSLAEYAARLADSRLTPMLSLPEASPIVRADGRLLWRVLDNLLSNAVKYAMPGTRVYISVSGGAGIAAACLSMKNISKEPLNMDPAELTERFVRGDAARSTDGSGLGLSITQSLMALQGGELHLSIDGDLFKAELLMPVCL